MEFEIIDFHTHPFLSEQENICMHRDYCDMSLLHTRELMEKLGISLICGSVIDAQRERGMPGSWGEIQRLNNTALALKEQFCDFYLPGFHVHPAFVTESCEEIERMEGLGVRLIGELVPYFHGWSDYSAPEFDRLIDCAAAHGMVISFHSMGEDCMDRMIEKHPKAVFVAAHPGEYAEFSRHMERMKLSKNLYLDTSGYGIHRHGMLRHAVALFGAERFLFGSDYPTCSPGMFVGGVLFDDGLTDAQKQLIFAGNAKRLLGL